MNHVSEIMTSRPACCQEQTPIAQVARMMVENDCGQIPVVNHQHEPVGVITDRDIAIRIVAADRDWSSCHASDAMTSPARTISMEAPVEECLSLMEDAQVRRVPVVDSSGILSGMVSLADVAAACRDKDVAEVVKKVSEPSLQE